MREAAFDGEEWEMLISTPMGARGKTSNLKPSVFGETSGLYTNGARLCGRLLATVTDERRIDHPRWGCVVTQVI